MNFGIIALIVLFVVIALGFVKKMNVGILAMTAAIIIGYLTGIYTKNEVNAGYSASLFLTLFGLTLFFGILNENGCLNVLMKKMIRQFSRVIWLVPILLFAASWLISFFAGGFAGMAFACGISMPVAHATGYHPFMMMIISNAGAQCGRYTWISPDGNIVLNLLAEQGIEGGLFTLTINMTIAMAIVSVLAFIWFKGYRVRKMEDESRIAAEKMTNQQKIALAVFVVVVLVIVGFGKDSGYMGLVGSVALMLLGVVDEKKAFQTIPWNTIMMVTGVGMLMNIVIISGGIDVMTKAVGSFTTPVTAGGVSCMTASIMSWFSSTLGVVVPTLTPTVSGLAREIGGNVSPISLLSAMLIGSSSACFSPASSVGGLILSTVVGDEAYKNRINENKGFVFLFIWSICMAALNSLLSMLGLYNM